ncbi:TetR family transcriptional regulator [Salinispora oceanensis]|uniref:TetR family transcriptional regulator n=1 Tax=Salinispora oceanensis TaxID=1050199 RepID=UPI0003819513|nr:TetR family transcriptional regulator [Salinispora oceanensis]
MAERLTRAQRQELTRARLLDAAEARFGDRGIHQTSLDEIAASVGLTKGAIYANFSSKNDLIAAILERKVGSPEEPLPIQSLATWAARLGDSFESNADRAETRRFALALIEFWLHGMRNEATRVLLAQWLRTVREANAQDAATLTGADLPLPADQLATLLLALDIGVGLQRLLDPEAVPAEVYTAGVEAILGREHPK